MTDMWRKDGVEALDRNERRAHAVGQWVMAAVVMLSFLHGEDVHFSWIMVPFSVYFLWDLYDSHRAGRPLWPTLTAAAKGLGRGILLFYGAVLLGSAFLLDGDGADRAVRLARLALPFFMVIYIEGKYPGGQGFARGTMASVVLLAVLGILYGPGAPTGRYQAFFAHPNNYGCILALVMPLGACYAWRARQALLRWGLAAALAACFFCLVRTESRAAMVAITGGTVLALACLVWIRRERLSARTRRACAAAMAAILLLGGGALWDMQSQKDPWSVLGGERLYMWEASYYMWSDHKLFGVGLANWEEAYYSPEYHPEEGKEDGLSFPHSMPAYFFSAGGTWDGGALVLFTAYTLLVLWRRAKKDSDVPFSLALLIVYFAFLLDGFFDATYTLKVGALSYYAILGYGLMKERSEEAKP